jgi:hypothetical protein
LPDLFAGIAPHGGADILFAQHDALPLQLEQPLPNKMPAGAVARHQAVLDQP